MSQIVTFKVKVFQQEHPLHPTEVFIKKYDLMSNFDERQVGEFVSQFEQLITEECYVNILKEYVKELMCLLSVKYFRYVTHNEIDQTVSVDIDTNELTVLCQDQMNETDNKETLSADLWSAYIGQVFCTKKYNGVLKAAIENCEFALFKNNAKYNALVNSIQNALMEQHMADIRENVTPQVVFE